MITSATQRPPPHPFYGDNWHRGLDPWHPEAFPSELGMSTVGAGPRQGGWFLEDAWGNEIAYCPDGTEINTSTVSIETSLEVK